MSRARAPQTVRLVIETMPANAVTRPIGPQVATAAEKVKKAKF